MPDIKWIKITSYIFEDEKIRLIDAMENGVMVIYVWLRLLVQAGKINANGYIYLTENIPYTEEMLATLFCKPLESIKFALKTLCDFQMIEIDSNKIIKILNWEKHQNVEGMERVRAQNRKRAENHREKKKQIEQAAKENFEETIGNNANCEEEKENFENINVQEDKDERMDNIIEENNSAVELDNSEVSSKDNIGHDTNVTEDTTSNKNSRSNGIVKKSCKDNNSTCDDKKSTCNVTVTEQNKKEIKNKKKIKRESSNTLYIKNKEPTYEKESEESTLSKLDNSKNNAVDIAADKNRNFEEGNKAIADKLNNSGDINKTTGTQSVNSKALEILMHYEKLTGIPGVFNPGSIALAIDMHGEKFVKMAINKSLELNKTDMPYINGILKNWRREGYPKDDEEVKKNGTRSTGKSNSADKNEFTGFKPKESRKLTEEQRKRAESNLI